MRSPSVPRRTVLPTLTTSLLDCGSLAVKGGFFHGVTWDVRPVPDPIGSRKVTFIECIIFVLGNQVTG